MKILYTGLEIPSHLQHSTLHCPFIKIIPKQIEDPTIVTAFAHFDDYTHLIFTSRTAVAVFFYFLHSFNIPQENVFNKIRISIGKRTAEKLYDFKTNASFIASEETAEGMIDLLTHQELKDAHIFFPHSSLARPIIKNWMSKQALRYTACPIYETISIFPIPLPDLRLFHEIIFTSPSTIDAFMKAYKQLPKEKKLTCIGPVTQNHLNRLLA